MSIVLVAQFMLRATTFAFVQSELSSLSLLTLVAADLDKSITQFRKNVRYAKSMAVPQLIAISMQV